MVRGTWVSAFVDGFGFSAGSARRKKGAGGRLAFWSAVDMEMVMGTFIGRACDRQRKDREDVSRGGEVRQESQRNDVIQRYSK